MAHDPIFLLFDDAREGGAVARLYRDPVATIEARELAEVVPALEQVRAALADGRHAAGYLGYEAGFALDPAFAGADRQTEGYLCWFGIFDEVHRPDGLELGQLLGDPRGALLGRPVPRIARRAYLSALGQVREHLLSGDIYQANFTFANDVPIVGSPLSAYARLRRSAGAGWAGIVRHPQGWILSLSPEQFFTIRGGIVEAKPMKGTAPRGSGAREDRAEIDRLQSDPKQRAENLMIVDLLRNDLARIAETGSVEVPDLFAVETFPTVHQMVSRVTARLRSGFDAVDVLKTIFPCGSITGAPKIAAMQILDRLVGAPRGAYTGSMGWIEPGGDAAFNVLIRTLELANGGERARLGLGSGVVVGSVAADEWDECQLKGEYVNRAVELPDLIETMRFDPAEGIAELDRHLDRLRTSADALGFRFDHHAARNELQAATFGGKQQAVARLLLSPSGAMAIEIRPVDPPSQTPARVKLAPLPVASDDYRLRHKTTDRDFYDEARKASGVDEVVFTDSEGRITEGSFTSVFVERDGKLLTPPESRGVLPGILRSTLIDSGQAVEADLGVEDLRDGFLIGNMVRGLRPARLV